MIASEHGVLGGTLSFSMGRDQFVYRSNVSTVQDLSHNYEFQGAFQAA